MRRSSRFRNKKIEVYIIGEGYTDDGGVYHEGVPDKIDTFDADVQPYSSELLYKQYGYKELVTKRVFMDMDNRIKVGLTVKYKEDDYEIKRIIDWDNDIELFLDNK